MPHLFCEEHGPEHETRARLQQASYRQLGEVVLIVKGTLISGPWHCDRCNARLKRGERAMLLTAFPRRAAEDMGGYDFAYEKWYFTMERAEVAVYGAAPAPPGGRPPGGLSG